MYKLILTLLMVLTPIYSSAASVYYGLYTDHAVSGQFNELNKVVIAQFDGGFSVGSMVNSYGKESTMFGYIQDNNKSIRLGFLAATGYTPQNIGMRGKIDSLPLMPMPLMSIHKKIANNVSVTANIVGGIVVNVGLSLSL